MLLFKQFFIITIAIMHFTLCIRFGRELKNDIDIKGRQSFFPKNDNEQSSQYENYNYINNNQNLNSQYFPTNDIANNNFKFSNDLRDQYDNGNNGIQFNGDFNQGEYFVENNPNLDINNYLNNVYDGPPQQQTQQYQTQQPSFNQQSSYFQSNPTNIDNYAQYYNYQNYPQSSFGGQQSIASAPPSQPPSRPPSRPYKKRKRPYPRPSSFAGQYQESPYQGSPLSGLPPAQRPYYSQQTYSPYPYDSSSQLYPQQNYANDYNQYQLNDVGGGGGNGITNFLQNIGQGAANLFSGSAAGGDYNPNLSNFGQFNPGFPGRPGPLRPQLQPQQQPSGPLGQFARVIEDITRNDDYQCIPKVLCQMVGSQRRQNVQSSILSSPIFSALISAVPSTTASLVFGRAALLGYTSGEHSCDGAYPKCPRNEDDLLYYLNNHRGGFFRFFNGGAAFGDDVNYQYNPNPLQQNSPQQQQNNQPQSALSQLSALQSLADSINSGSGINLSNLGSNGALLGNLASLIGSGGAGGGGAGGLGGLASLGNLAALAGGQNTQQSPVGTSIFGGAGGGSGLGGINGGSVSELLGNLLTGFVGNRFSSRKIKKRSIVNDNSTVSHANSTVDELQFIRNVPSSVVDDNLNDTETKIDNVIDILLLPDEEILSGKQSISKKRDLSEDLEEIVTNKNETIIDICKNCNITIGDEIEDSKEIESNEISADEKDSKDDNDHAEDDDSGSAIEDDDDYQFPDVEARIVNAKQLLQSEDTMDKDNLVIFPTNDDDDPLRDGKYLNIINDNEDFVKSTIFTFDNDNRDNVNVKFIENINDIQLKQQTPQFQQPDGPIHVKFPDIATNRFSKKLDDNDDKHPIRTRMIFPDRTGTGNLRFDNNYFNNNYYSNRFGKILTGTKSDNNDNSNSNNNDQFYFSSQNNNNNDIYSNKYNHNNNDNGNEYNKVNYYKPSGQQQTTLPSYGNQNYQPDYLAPIAVYPASNNNNNNKYNDNKYGNENNYQNNYSNNNNYNNQNTNSANNAVNKFPSLLSALFGINNSGGISNTGSSNIGSSSSNSGTNSNINYSNYNYNNNNKYNNNNNNQYVRNEDTSQNVYVTNSKGVIEYYINASGKKVYV